MNTKAGTHPLPPVERVECHSKRTLPSRRGGSRTARPSTQAHPTRFSREEPATVKTGAGIHPLFRTPKGASREGAPSPLEDRGWNPSFILTPTFQTALSLTHPPPIPPPNIIPTVAPSPTRFSREEPAPVKTGAGIHPSS